MRQLDLFDDSAELGIPAEMLYRGAVSSQDRGHSELVFKFAQDFQRRGFRIAHAGPMGEGLLPGEFCLSTQDRIEGEKVPFDFVARTLADTGNLFIKLSASSRGRSQTSVYRLFPYLRAASASTLFRGGLYLVLIGDTRARLRSKFPAEEKELASRNKKSQKTNGAEVYMMTYEEFGSGHLHTRIQNNHVLPE